MGACGALGEAALMGAGSFRFGGNRRTRQERPTGGAIDRCVSGAGELPGSGILPDTSSPGSESQATGGLYWVTGFWHNRDKWGRAGEWWSCRGSGVRM